MEIGWLPGIQGTHAGGANKAGVKEASLKVECAGYLQGDGVWGTKRQRERHVRRQWSHVQEQVA